MFRQDGLRARFGVAGLLLLLLFPGAGCGNATEDTSAGTTTIEGRTASGIAYDVTGMGSPVVLIHGAMLDRRQWTPQRALSARFTVVTYDTRWHGRSAGADTNFRAADDLAAVLDAVGIHTASIVGLSNGARIALDFALQHPTRVDRLVLASPGLGGYVATERPSFLEPMVAALSVKDFTAAANALAGTPVMEVGGTDSAWVAAVVRDNASVFQQDPSHELAPEPPAITRLTELQAPVLVVTGSRDMRDVIATGDTLLRAIPNAKRLMIDGAKHLLNITHAEQFNSAVMYFLTASRAR